jgi:hypothetical protein
MDLMSDDCCIQTLDVARRFADGVATESDLAAASQRVLEYIRAHPTDWDFPPGARPRTAIYGDWAAAKTVHDEAWQAVGQAAWETIKATASRLPKGKVDNPGAGLCPLVRCVFGNPFRPHLTLPGDTRIAIVVKMATAIYEERRFKDMPILADALEEAGCDNRDVLTHCRADTPHARGCCVVDLVLGKS